MRCCRCGWCIISSCCCRYSCVCVMLICFIVCLMIVCVCVCRLCWMMVRVFMLVWMN